MSKVFRLPLLAALPVLLGACARETVIDNYQRRHFNTYAECMAYYQPQIAQGLQNPCARVATPGGGFYGPYFLITSGFTRYVGYNSSGYPSSTGLKLDSKSGRYSSFSPNTRASRGGFGGSRGGGSFGG